MISEINYINIREILSRLHRNPLLSDTTLEQVIQYTIDFMAIMSCPNMFRDEEAEIHIEDYRGLLPCSLISINQVKDCRTKICLRSMTDTFDSKNNQELTFKTQGRVLFTSFKEGDVIVSYKSIPVDDDGFPLLIDNPVYLRTLEAYIKKEIFTILFDMSKINGPVLQNAQQDYAFKAAQCQSEFTIPSISEMESIKNMWNTLVQRTTDFDNGFKSLGKREYIKLQ